MAPASPANEAALGGVADFMQMLYRRKGALALLVVAGVAVAALITAMQDRVYESKASIEIQSANENFLNLHDINPTAIPLSASAEFYVQTQADILHQDVLIEQVVKALKLDTLPEFQPQPGRWNSLRAALGWKPDPNPAESHASPVRRAANIAKKRLQIKSSRLTQVVDIVFDSKNPQLAADFANTLAETFIDQSVESRRKAAQEVQDWLGPQLGDLKVKLDKSEAALDAYARASGLMLTPGNQSLAEEKLKSIQDELAKAQGDRIARQAQYGLMATNKPETIVDDPSLRDYEAKIVELRRQLADLETLLTPENNKVVRLKAQVDALEAARQKATQQIGKRLQNDYTSAEARESKLDAAYASQSARVANLATKMTHYDTLKHDVDTNRQFYVAMLQRINDASVASAVRQSNIRLVGPAMPATIPYKPNVPQNLLVGLVSGLALGLGFVLLAEFGNRGLREPGEAGAYLNLPELGAIPKFEQLTEFPQRLLGSAGGTHSVERVAHEQRLSGWSDSFRAAAASIMASGRNGDHPRVLVVTSSVPMEGKTTVAGNLAVALAEISRRVLVIDADVRWPRLHKVFNLDNGWGLSDLLCDRDAADGVPLEDLAKKTSVPHLYLLPSGPGADNVFGMLYSERMRRLMGRFRREFDHVIVDAPPCLEIPDARILARHADGVVLVVRANHADKRSALAAAQRLLLDGIPVVGTILNDWDPAGGAKSYGYGSAYGYGARTTHDRIA
jgi:capsular exopolysaccharide synthesis family protein